MPDLTPTQLHTLVAPLRDAIGERWPKQGDAELVYVDPRVVVGETGDPLWVYRGHWLDSEARKVSQFYDNCDEDAAAERLEFAVDRTIDAHAENLGLIPIVRRIWIGGIADAWVAAMYRDHPTRGLLVDGNLDILHVDRLAAKCGLLGRIVGVEVKQ